MAINKVRPAELRLQFLLKSFVGEITKKEVDKIKSNYIKDLLYDILSGVSNIDISTYKTDIKSIRKLLKSYTESVDEIRAQFIDSFSNTNKTGRTKIALFEKAYKEGSDVVKKIEDFLNSKIHYKIDGIDTALDTLVKADKKEKAKDIAKKGLATTVAAAVGSPLIAGIPEGLKALTKELKDFKSNSKTGKVKQAGSATLGGLGFLFDSPLMMMGSAALKDKANRDLEIKKYNEDLQKSFKQQKSRAKERYSDEFDLSGNAPSSPSTKISTGGNVSNVDVVNIFRILEEAGVFGDQLKSGVRNSARRYGYHFAKGGLVNIVGKANSKLGGATVNEEGQEQAIILPAKGNNPLVEISKKLTQTNKYLSSLDKTADDSLEMQEDQARLAALAQKDTPLDKYNFSNLMSKKDENVKTTNTSILSDLLLKDAITNSVPFLISNLPLILASTAAVVAIGDVAKAVITGESFSNDIARKIGLVKSKEDIEKGTDSRSNLNPLKWVGMVIDKPTELLANLYVKFENLLGSSGKNKPDVKAAKGANFIADKPTNILAGEAGKEHVKIIPKPDDKSFPSGNIRNPLYVVLDDRKKKVAPKDEEQAKIQADTFSLMQQYYSEKIKDKQSKTAEEEYDKWHGGDEDSKPSLFERAKNFFTGGSEPSTNKPNGAMANISGPLGDPNDKNKKPVKQVVDAGAGYTVVERNDKSVEKRVGNRNWRNNNPGNLNYGDFSRRHGAVGTDGRFAVFPTYEAGRAAKQSLLFDKNSRYANLSLSEAIYKYAPPNENDTRRYLNTVLGVVGKDKIMTAYNAGEQTAIMNAMEKIEGYKVGKVMNVASQSKAGGGGAFLTNGPTSLLVGDNPGGKELVSVSPLSGKGKTTINANSGLKPATNYMNEGNVKNIKNNSSQGTLINNLNRAEAMTDVAMNSKLVYGTKEAINNINISSGGGSVAPSEPSPIFTGDNISFAARVAKLY